MWLIASGSGSNSGYSIYNNDPLYFKGGEEITVCFRLETTGASTIEYLGMLDLLGAGTPTIGLWINIANTTLSGKSAKSGGGTTTTGTTYTVSTGTWYRIKIVHTTAGSRADFTLYNASGTQLWTDSTVTNVPYQSSGGAARMVMTALNSGSAVNLMYLDYYRMRYTLALTR